MKRFGITVIVVAAVALSAAGQDAVEIKIAYPKTGERVKVTVEEKATTKMVATAMGLEQKKDETKTKSFVYTDEVLDNPGAAKRPAKVKRTYEKAVTGSDGKTATLPLEGKTVLIEKKGDKYTFTADDKAVEGESLKVLDAEFNKSEKESDREVMFPASPVKPGDSWKIDSTKMAKELSKDFELDPAKLVAGGKLVKAYQKGGKQFGVIELTVAASLSGLGAKSGLKLKGDAMSSMSLTLSGDGVIDGSSSEGKSRSVVKFNVAATADGGVDLKIDATVIEDRTVEALPKK